MKNLDCFASVYFLICVTVSRSRMSLSWIVLTVDTGIFLGPVIFANSSKGFKQRVDVESMKIRIVGYEESANSENLVNILATQRVASLLHLNGRYCIAAF
jgi:hypothetical protein